MSESESTMMTFARKAVEMALEPLNHEHVLSCSLVVDLETRKLFLKIHFHTPPTEDVVDDYQVASSEISAAMPEDFEVSVELEIVPPNSRPHVPPGATTILPSEISQSRVASTSEQ